LGGDTLDFSHLDPDNEAYTGGLADFRLYTCILSSDEINGIYKATAPSGYACDPNYLAWILIVVNIFYIFASKQ